MEDIHLGDSIAMNGVCLTVTSFDDHSYSVDIMHESLKRTNLADMKAGSRVNLERAMPANGRFGGHIVAGHVDGTGVITSMEKDDNAVWIYVDTEPSVLKYIVEKGSITIDGISLTVAKVDSKSFAVSVIPHTGAHTTLLEKKAGDTVNLETDIIGKYVEKLLGYKAEEEKNASSNITMEFLARHGFD
jgi:riboflavin synthase